MRLRFGVTAAGIVLAAVGIGLFAAQSASAAISGPCTASLAGANITDIPVEEGHAIVVGKNEVVPMTMTAPAGKRFSALRIYLDFAGSQWDVYNAPAGGGTWSHNIDVHSFARYGVGYYRLGGVGDFTDGSQSCEGIAMVNVHGNPLGTVAGISAAASTGVGIAGILGAGLGAGGGGGNGGDGQAYTQGDATADELREKKNREFEDATKDIARHGWCWLMAIAALPLLLLWGTGALMMTVVAPAAVRVKRHAWPFVVGPLGGLLTGLGGGVLLQEYAIVYPTRAWAIIYLAGGIAFGFAVPMLRRMLSR